MRWLEVTEMTLSKSEANDLRQDIANYNITNLTCQMPGQCIQNMTSNALENVVIALSDARSNLWNNKV